MCKRFFPSILWGFLLGGLLCFPSLGAIAPEGIESKEPEKPTFQIEFDLLAFYALSPGGKEMGFCEIKVHPDKIQVNSEIVLLDLASGKELKRSARLRGVSTSGVFSADAKYLGLGAMDQREFKPGLWDVGRWQKGRNLELPENHWNGKPLAFSLDGKWLAGLSYPKDGSQEKMVVWETASGKPRVLEEPKQKSMKGRHWGSGLGGGWGRIPLDMVFADDSGPFLFVERNGIMQQWDLGTGKLVHSYGEGWFIERMQLEAKRCMGGIVPGSMADKYRFRGTPDGRLLVLPRYRRLPLAAIPYPDGSIALVLTPSGKDWGLFPNHQSKEEVLCRFDQFQGTSRRSCVLTPDGNHLVAVGIDPKSVKKEEKRWQILIWNVSKFRSIAEGKIRKPPDQDLAIYVEVLFKSHYELDEHDILRRSAAHNQLFKVHQGMLALAAHPDKAVPLLQQKVGPPADVKRIPRWLEDLNSPDFKTRDQAQRTLQGMGPVIQPYLAKALTNKPSLDMKIRLEGLLQKHKEGKAALETGWLRTIDLLEHMCTKEAREFLRTLAAGGYGSFVEEAAQAALRRLQKK
jgi:hypothetical protein